MQLNGYRSGWTEIRSGVPQWSVLGPLLFTTFIDYINKEVLCKIFKFAKVINTLNDTRSMQKILNILIA